ncbi:hypothetical protein E3P91_00109 [Wallemia ichthyophaga]|nr:hypothetical protein E3P91_00109 [Wallemia ichthyophaga]
MEIDKENKMGIKRKDTSNATITPNKKQKRSIIEYKNKLVFKQKPLNLSKNTKTLQSLLDFHQFLSSLNDNLNQIPSNHLQLISILTHESDKQLNDLIKHVKSQIKPSNFKFDITQSALQSAIKEVAQFKNYGLDGDDLPNTLKLFKWEVNNLDHLPLDSLDSLKQRRFDREFSQQKLFESIEGVDRCDLETFLSHAASVPTPALDRSKKEDEKRRKDEEKAEDKRKKDEEKQRKEAEKQEEKQRKEDEKQDEKQRKEDEKQKKEDEKNDKIAAANQKKEKQSSAFKGFFSKVATPKKHLSPSKDVSDFHKTFKPFHLKQGFEMAPINAFNPAQFDDLWDTINKATPDDITLSSSLSEIPKWKIIKKNPAVASKHVPSNTKIAPPVDLRLIMQQLSEAEVGGDEDQTTDILESFKTRFRGKVKHKLLEYHEDYRPGWWGTCTKSSSTIGPRRPLAKDALQFDYTYDSEVEWGEEEQDEKGEEIQSQPGSDDEKDKDNDSDADSWLVSDTEDVGLEGVDLDNVDNVDSVNSLNIPPDLKTDDPIDNAIAAEKRNERAKAKKKNKSKKPNQPSKPYISGLKWESEDGQITYPPFMTYQIRFFNDAQVSVNPKEFVSQFKPTLVTQQQQQQQQQPMQAESSTTGEKVDGDSKTPSKETSTTQGKITSIPETHIQLFASVVENSTKSRILLVEELRQKFTMDASGVFGNDYITNKETLLDFDEKESTTTIMFPSTSQGIDKDRPKLVNPNEELGNEEVLKPHLKDLLRVMLIANVE